MTKRKNIPQKLSKKIFQEANSECPFCNERDIECLEIHHIYPVSKGGGNEPENLMFKLPQSDNVWRNKDLPSH